MSKQTNFIAKIAPMSRRDMAQTGILASLTIAQAILESSWGASGLTVAANKLACKHIQQAGYATAPTYANVLIKLIEDYKLYEFDKANCTTPTVGFYPACAYKGVSIAEALRSIEADFSFGNRSNIARANGIKNYQGTPKQNTQMLNQLKQGKLKRGA